MQAHSHLNLFPGVRILFFLYDCLSLPSTIFSFFLLRFAWFSCHRCTSSLCPQVMPQHTTVNSAWTTDIELRSQHLRHLYPGMELQLVVFRFFPQLKELIHQVHMYCSYCLGAKIKTHMEHYKAQRSWMHSVCFCFCMCGWFGCEDKNM